LFGIATDDSHHYHAESGNLQHSSLPGRGWTMVRARHLTPESLIRAIKQGDMYASTGVTLNEIRYDAESGVVELEIEPDGDAVFTTDFIGTPLDYNPMSEPRKNKEGQEIRSTRKYSSDIGKIFATVKGLNPSYQLTGKELYVRAVVTSDAHHKNPSFDHQHLQAWTQPVGWEKRLGSNHSGVATPEKK
jgi:hypothetical protein